jgi:hypothetical protein
MITPRKKLDAEVEAIAAKYGLTAHEAIHVGRTRRRMIPRFEIYAHVVAHYGGNVTAASRYLQKDITTILNGLGRRKRRCEDQ